MTAPGAPHVTSTLARPVPALGRQRTPRLPTVAERTLDDGLRVLAVRRPGRPARRAAAAGAVLRQGRRPRREGPAARRHPAVRHRPADRRRSSPPTCRRSAARCRPASTATGSASAGRCSSTGLPGPAGAARRGADQRVLPQGRGRGRARAPRPRARRAPQPGRRGRPRGAAVAGCTATTRTAASCRPARRSRPSRPARCAALHAQAGRARGQRARARRRPRAGPRPRRRSRRRWRGWTATGAAAVAPPLPDDPPGAALLVDRPGAVQTTIRMAGARAAPHRPRPRGADAGQPGLRRLLLLPLGGQHPRGQGLHLQPALRRRPPAGRAPRLTLATDVATDVTAPALLETLYELGRIATVPVGQDELDQARRYADRLARAVDRLAGRAGQHALGAHGQRARPDVAARLAAGAVEGHRRRRAGGAAAATWRRPGFTTVLVGDAATVRGPVSQVLPVEHGVTRPGPLALRRRPRRRHPRPTRPRSTRPGTRARVLVVDDGRTLLDGTDLVLVEPGRGAGGRPALPRAAGRAAVLRGRRAAARAGSAPARRACARSGAALSRPRRRAADPRGRAGQLARRAPALPALRRPHAQHRRAAPSASATPTAAAHFPRTDPAVIVLITDGADRARPRPAGRLAGAALLHARRLRRARGERRAGGGPRGRRGGRRSPSAQVVYRGSQPWPFPASLMLGYRAVCDADAEPVPARRRARGRPLVHPGGAARTPAAGRAAAGRSCCRRRCRSRTG